MECIACSNTNLEIYSKNSFLNIPIFTCKNCGILISGESKEQLESSLKDFYDIERKELNQENQKKIEYDFEGSIGVYAKNLWLSHFKYCKKFIKKIKKIVRNWSWIRIKS